MPRSHRFKDCDFGGHTPVYKRLLEFANGIRVTERVRKKGQFVIPQEIREALGIKEGDELVVTLDEGRIIITQPERYAQLTRGLLKGTWGSTRRQVNQYIDKERQSWE